MAAIRCDFFSEVLEVGTSITVLLPQATEEQIGVERAVRRTGDFPVLYLLHGLSDDSTAWQRYTSIERYAAPLGLAVVMPQVQRSFYADEVHGGSYWTFLTEELPAVVRSFFRISDRPEDTFVAGLSMGGYGAFKWALHHPDRFAGAASLSGALDIEAISHDEWRRPLFQRVFDGRPGPDADLFAVLEEADPAAVPPLYLGCGTEDHLVEGNRRFLEAAKAKGVQVHTDFRPGEHEWGLWDATIRDVLAWLPLDR